jgi:NAD+ kinase
MQDMDLHRLGVVVHPTRNLDRPLDALRRWSKRRGAELVQVPVPGNEREVMQAGGPDDCDLIVSIGGDGTMLAAIRASLHLECPVLGVASGSLGALTSVEEDSVERALDRLANQDWVPRRLPGLDITRKEGDSLVALNDIAIVRAGQGQIRATARVDGTLYARLAGDGCIVSTAVGSSAYALAAGGPLLAPGAHAFLLTPLPTHGGFHPPLVIGADSRLELDTDAGLGGIRVELDGQVTNLKVSSLQVQLRPEIATLVSFADQESLLQGLRRRQIIIDSPRILADDGRR